ncbi:hypothetical protein IGI04_021911 [Brassica rapa subsp. trilocularis]|uniref:Uncharacterized protein n=1 Tax=Brassica rapa subsp. trilocularis TaxID=1813537 RepID=A0ABQ7M1V0_BRACM|nr:hypothetical protein IGI04_021911 [Brassica rapa subsp. trilocularis]
MATIPPQFFRASQIYFFCVLDYGRRRWRRWWCRVQLTHGGGGFRDFKGRRNGMIKALTTEAVSDTKKAIELDPALAKAYLRKRLVKEKIEFAVNQMNWPLEVVALFPQLLGYSMEKGLCLGVT